MKQKQKVPKKKLITIVSLSVCLPIALGVTAGIVVSKFFLGPANQADYSNINSADLVVDNDQLMAKYQNIKESGDSYIDNLKPYEIVNIAYNLFTSYENSTIFSTGMISASVVSQSLVSCAIKNGESIMEESLSYSNLVDLASRVYYDGTKITYWGGHTTSKTSATYDGYADYTLDEYAEAFGRMPYEPLAYIVSKKTVLSKSVSIETTNDGYQIYMETHPVKSVVKYAKQIRSLSNLANEPSFDEVKLTFNVDKNLLIKSLYIDETYYAKTSSGVGSTTNGKINVTYTVDTDYKIPSKDEVVNYPEEK